MAATRIFISHHHSPDEDSFTARLKVDLRAAGADVWVDDDQITSDDFVKRIGEGLEGRQWLVLVMSPDALKSQWVRTEVNAALNQVHKGRMLGVIPIVAKPCRDADIPVLWDSLHRYDATRDYSTAIAGLMRALGLSVPVSPPPADLPAAQQQSVERPLWRPRAWANEPPQSLPAPGVRPDSNQPVSAATLTVLQGNEPGRVYTLTKERITLGRSRDGDLYFQDLAQSRVHASIRRTEEGRYVVRDENSANGTFVNHQRITDQVLTEGDEIQIGQVVLLFRQSDAAAVSH